MMARITQTHIAEKIRTSINAIADILKVILFFLQFVTNMSFNKK